MTKFIPQKPTRKRVQLSTPEKSITDQTLLNEFSMASIKKKLENRIPITNLTNNVFYDLKPLQYTNLQDMLTFHEQVQKTFDSLPVELRKEMGHDVKNFEDYLSNPDNNDKLYRYGLASRPDSTNREVVDAVNSLKEHIKPKKEASSGKQNDT